MAASFYRAVSFAELADWRVSGTLRASAGSCEGKHLACSLEDARRWGEVWYGAGGFAVLRVTVDDAAAQGFAAWARLDGIGPARFATIDELEGALVEEVVNGS